MSLWKLSDDSDDLEGGDLKEFETQKGISSQFNNGQQRFLDTPLCNYTTFIDLIQI